LTESSRDKERCEKQQHTIVAFIFVAWLICLLAKTFKRFYGKTKRGTGTPAEKKSYSSKVIKG
jgi:hypothetical protein